MRVYQRAHVYSENLLCMNIWQTSLGCLKSLFMYSLCHPGTWRKSVSGSIWTRVCSLAQSVTLDLWSRCMTHFVLSLTAAPLPDSGRPDGRSSGSHERALPDGSQSHDAERESVVNVHVGLGYVLFIHFHHGCINHSYTCTVPFVHQTKTVKDYFSFSLRYYVTNKLVSKCHPGNKVACLHRPWNKD